MPGELAQAGYLSVEGAELFYEVAGKGLPLVLIHAGVADHRMWDETFERFAQRSRTVRYDMRNFGKSPSAAVSFSNRADLRALLDHLEIDRAAVLGVSFGGRTALEFTLEFPERVSRLILVSTGLQGLDHEPTAREKALFQRDEELGDAEDWEGMAALDVELWVEGPGQPAGRAPAGARQMVRAMALSNYVGESRRFPAGSKEPNPVPLEPAAVTRLHEVAVPTLIMVGELDTSATLAAADRLADGIPDAQKVSFEGTAHMLSLEEPERFESTALEFLRR